MRFRDEITSAIVAHVAEYEGRKSAFAGGYQAAIKDCLAEWQTYIPREHRDATHKDHVARLIGFCEGYMLGTFDAGAGGRQKGMLQACADVVEAATGLPVDVRRFVRQHTARGKQL